MEFNTIVPFLQEDQCHLAAQSSLLVPWNKENMSYQLRDH